MYGTCIKQQGNAMFLLFIFLMCQGVNYGKIREMLFSLPRGKLNKINKSINQLCLTRVTLNSLTTDKPVALGFQIKLEFGNVGF